MFYKSYHSTDQEWHGEADKTSGIPILTTVPLGHPKKLSLNPFKPNELKNIDKTYPMLMSDEAREWFKLVVDEECFPNHTVEDPIDYFQFKKFTYAKWLANHNSTLENLALQEQISRDRGSNANITILHGVGRFAWGDETISVGTGEMFIVRSNIPEKEPFFLCEVLKVFSTENEDNDDIIKYKLCFWIKDEKATKVLTQKNSNSAEIALDDIFLDTSDVELDHSSQRDVIKEDIAVDADRFLKSRFISQWLTCKWKKANPKNAKNCITITQNEILLYDFTLHNKCLKKSTAEKIKDGIRADIIDGSFSIWVMYDK